MQKRGVPAPSANNRAFARSVKRASIDLGTRSSRWCPHPDSPCENAGSPPQAQTTAPSQGLPNALPLTLAPDPPGGVCTRTRHAKTCGPRPKRKQPRLHKICQTRFQRPWHPTPQVVFAPGPAMQNVGSPPQARTTVPSQGLSNALPLTLAPDPPRGVCTRTRHAKMWGPRPKRKQPRIRKVCQTHSH